MICPKFSVFGIHEGWKDEGCKLKAEYISKEVTYELVITDTMSPLSLATYYTKWQIDRQGSAATRIRGAQPNILPLMIGLLKTHSSFLLYLPNISLTPRLVIIQKYISLLIIWSKLKAESNQRCRNSHWAGQMDLFALFIDACHSIELLCQISFGSVIGQFSKQKAKYVFWG